MFCNDTQKAKIRKNQYLQNIQNPKIHENQLPQNLQNLKICENQLPRKLITKSISFHTTPIYKKRICSTVHDLLNSFRVYNRLDLEQRKGVLCYAPINLPPPNGMAVLEISHALAKIWPFCSYNPLFWGQMTQKSSREKNGFTFLKQSNKGL